MACEADISEAHQDQAKQEYHDDVISIGESKWEDLTDAECTMVSGGLEEFKAAEIEKAMEKQDNEKEIIAAWLDCHAYQKMPHY